MKYPLCIFVCKSTVMYKILHIKTHDKHESSKQANKSQPNLQLILEKRTNGNSA